MRKRFLLLSLQLSLFLLLGVNTTAQVHNGNFNLTTQAQVDGGNYGPFEVAFTSANEK